MVECGNDGIHVSFLSVGGRHGRRPGRQAQGWAEIIVISLISAVPARSVADWSWNDGRDAPQNAGGRLTSAPRWERRRIACRRIGRRSPRPSMSA